MTTYQHRRYAMIPERFDEFLTWYRAGVPELRARYGFTVEWCVVDREHDRFDWLVSHPGTEDEFLAAAAAFEASEDWKAYLGRVQPSLRELEVSFVEVWVPPRTE